MIVLYTGLRNITGLLADYRYFCMQKLKQQQLFDRIFERLPDHVTLLLIIISGFLLARLTWMMFPSDPTMLKPLANEQETRGVSVIKAHAKSTDLGQEIAGYHLLGVYKPPPPPKPKPVVKAKAPPKPEPKPKKPRPPLQLVGVYALSGKAGIAIINVKGKQEVVGLGEAIGDSGATLVKVHADHVEISWEGEADKLSMPNIDKSAQAAIQLPAGQQPQAQPQQTVQKASLRQAGQSRGVSAGAKPAAGANTGAGSAAAKPGAGPVSTIPGAAQPTTAIPGAQPQRSAPAGQSKAPVPGQSSSAKEAAPKLAEFRQEILNNNINLLQVIRPSPKKENGQLIGFRIRPGTNRALFNQTGLRSGDIVTEINGTPLTSNTSSMQAMQSLTTSSGATLSVLRGGQSTTVQVSF